MEEPNTDEINELQQLEEDVKSMAQRIPDCNQFTNTLNSIISAQRPANLTRSDGNSDPGPSGNPNLDARIPFDSEGRVEILVEKDPMNIENVQLIKQKISCNASAEPLHVKRIKDLLSTKT